MLGRRTAVSGVLMIAVRLVTRLVDVLMMLVLARLLLPADFGLVAMAMSAVAVVEAALEMPLNQALLRLPEISRRHYDTAFTLSVLRGLAIMSVLAIVAWPFSSFYGNGRLFPLICTLALGANARGLTSPRLAEYQKNISFWRDFTTEIIGKVTSIAVAIVVALLTRSYWAIAAGSVSYPLVVMFCSYALAPYRPRLSLAELPVFSAFVGWMSLAQVINALNWQSERLLIGKLQPAAQLGLFSAANDMASIPLLAIFGPVVRPVLAALSSIGDDAPRLARCCQLASCGALALGLPLLVGEALLARPAIPVVLGPKWLDAVPLLQGLSLSLIPGLFAFPAYPLVMSHGRPVMMLYRNLIEFSVKLPLLIIGAIKFGLIGIVFARLASETATVLYSVVVIRKLTKLSILEQLTAPWRSIVSTCLMVPPVMFCVGQIQPNESVLQISMNLALTACVGAFTYVSSSILLWRLVGCPDSIEALLVNAVVAYVKKAAYFNKMTNPA